VWRSLTSENVGFRQGDNQTKNWGGEGCLISNLPPSIKPNLCWTREMAGGPKAEFVSSRVVFGRKSIL